MLIRHLFKPIDIAPLVYFRILGGLLMTTEITGELFTHYRVDLVETQFHFSYPFFEWVVRWSGPMLYLHYAVTIVAGLCVTAGLYYRVSTLVFAFGSTWLFLMEATLFINHLYLYCLLAWILAVLPAHRALSLDVRRKPAIVQTSAPAWTRQILLFQIGVVYFFAGVAKFDADWLAGLPLEVWLPARSGYPLIGRLLDEPWLPPVMAYGGLLFDLLIVPGMLWRRTRRFAFALALLFHLTNVSIYGIGTFPWFSMMMTALFFPPESFRKLPLLRSALPPYRPDDHSAATPQNRRRAMAALLIVWVVVQLVVPLRPFVYPGPTRWTEAGHRFAWRMMLRQKRATIFFHVTDPRTNQSWTVFPTTYLSRHQSADMAGKPDLILQFAHFLAEEFARNGVADAEVRVSCAVSLNGRPFQKLVDGRVDLARERRQVGYDWIVPLGEK